jgi:arabinofuranosyltransferase
MDSEHKKNSPAPRTVQLILILLFAVTLIRTAWVNDDAYITLRTVDNFVHGYGLTWNPGERVQAYTHPLWMFMLSGFYALTHEAYFTTLALSFTLSVSVVILVSLFFTKDLFSTAAGLLILSLSPAFVEYSTSGLENPLTYFLLTLFLILTFRLPERPTRGQIFSLGLLTSLAMLNRLDTGLFCLPVVLWVFFRQRSWRTFWALALSTLPILLWETFSLLYYGFLLPNTAYAKLNTGVSQIDLLAQGWKYFANALVWDPLTFLGILAGMFLAFSQGSRLEKSIAAGVVLYLLYILSIGGDFMSGRFFAAPLLVSVVLLMRFTTRVKIPWKPAVLAAVIGLGFLAHSPTQLNTPKSPENAIAKSGIADERAFYFSDSGLIHIDLHTSPIPNHPWAHDGLKLRKQGGVSVQYSIGYLGYFAGPGVHIVDQYALAEPLLARLPIPDPKDWRIGHFIRPVPEGYVETLETGTNRLADPGLAQYVDKLRLITRGKIFDPTRLKTILEMNLGKYDSLLLGYIQSQSGKIYPLIH